jgi:hypothetical protein
MGPMATLEFLRRHARAGCVGLFGGSSIVDLGIRKAQAALDPAGKPSLWSHAAIFEGDRVDGRGWLIESDFEITPGQLRSGVQESRLDKYEDPSVWPNVAVLDFGLQESQVREVLSAGLDFLARRARYALGGLLETWWAVMTKSLGQGREKESTFCSAFVRAAYSAASVDLAPGIAIQHTTPEHLARTPVPHERHLLVRDPA